MRAPVDTIAAPPFLPQLRWANLPKGTPRLRMDKLQGRPVLIEFWDFCRPNSMRTLPYVKAWHQRYGQREDGLQVIGVHSPGFEPSRDRKRVLEALQRLQVTYPVLIDSDLEMWQEYENLGWPARYLFDRMGRLFDYHYGEGAYQETELAIQALLASPGRPAEDEQSPEDRDSTPAPLAPLRPEDAPGAMLAPQTEDQEGAYSGPYEAGGVWVVLDGEGSLSASDGAGASTTLQVDHPGAYPIMEHERHTRGVLRIEMTEGVRCLATCFTPGLA